MIPGLPYDTEIPDRVGVLVLGSGLAGCAALLAAAEAGQFAVMLEKTSEIGGSTVKSAGLSTPVQVLGLSSVPEAGDEFRAALAPGAAAAWPAPK